MIAPQPLALQGSKDTSYTFDEVTANFKEGKTENNFLKYLYLYWIKMKSHAVYYMGEALLI